MIIIRIQINPELASGRLRRSPALNAEYVELLNEISRECDIGEWSLSVSVNYRKFHGIPPQVLFAFPKGTKVEAGQTIRVHTGQGTSTPPKQPTDFYLNRSQYFWSQPGVTTAKLLDAKGQLIHQKPLADFTKEKPEDQPLPQLYAASSALGYWQGQTYTPAIELSWEVPLHPATDTSPPTFASPKELNLYILRRETRFPDLNLTPSSGPSGPRNSRRGVKPVTVENDEKLKDGTPIYSSDTFQTDLEETREEWEGDILVKTIRQYQVPGNPADRVLCRSIRYESKRKTPLTAPIPQRMTVHVWDRDNLQAGTVYYYTAYVRKPKEQERQEQKRRFSSRTQASALATGYHGHNLFKALPQIHQQLDIQTPIPPESVALADRTKGQLQRLLEVFDAHLDLLHGTTEGLLNLHNVQRADSRLLPHLAHLIGWRLKDNLNEQQQRNEIDFAPEVYKTVGTIPLITGIINRHTGWTAKVKEFAQNVLVSFDPNRLEMTEGTTTFYLDRALIPTPAYQDYLNYLEEKDSQPQTPPESPPPLPAPDQRWHGHVLPDPDDVIPSDPQSQLEMRRKLPPGSINPADAAAMYRYRSRDIHDTTAYTLDFRDLPQQQKSGQRIDTTGWYNPRTIGIYLTPDVDVEPLVFQETTEQLRTILAQFLPIHVKVVFFIKFIPIEDWYNSLQETEAWKMIKWKVFESNSLEHRSVKPANPPDTHFRTWWRGSSYPKP